MERSPAAQIELRDLATKAARVRFAFAGRDMFDGRTEVAADESVEPATVVLHDVLESHLAWTDVLPRLGGGGRVAVALDLPGAGESEKPPSSRFSYEFSAFAEVVVDVVAGLRLGRVNLVGHGLGAAIALACAASHPAMVTKLVLVAPTVYEGGRSPLDRVARVPIFGPLAIKQLVGPSEFRRFFREYVYAEGANVSPARVLEHFERFSAPAAREATFATIRATSDRRPVVALVPRVRQETLVVTGRLDRLVPAHHGRRLVRELAQARLLALDCGHSPPEEDPSGLADAILGFLAPKKRASDRAPSRASERPIVRAGGRGE
jgi:haloacetate dehalogenase